MKTFIESISLPVGTLLIGFLSAMIVWLLCALLPRVPHPLWMVIVPFVLAYSLFWLPV